VDETGSFLYTLGYVILANTHNFAYDMLSRKRLRQKALEIRQFCQ